MQVSVIAPRLVVREMDLATLYQHLFSSHHRLYGLDGNSPVEELAVEAWIGREGVSMLSESRIIALSANADIPLRACSDSESRCLPHSRAAGCRVVPAWSAKPKSSVLMAAWRATG
ncbi:hypothetical protein CBM2609_B30057 [Cupriavidus taiwanensis]|nr:hypothetical protein CBM2604_B40057 [Cupriavidus taiwanensis]SOZ32365.1 hypothetical protein CBM2609_B30057 [Cupriavidus taiwanensis]SOZ47957.1 hypothetical protein CBM2610_B30056 [Cupriavidus taiwanensis]